MTVTLSDLPTLRTKSPRAKPLKSGFKGHHYSSKSSPPTDTMLELIVTLFSNLQEILMPRALLLAVIVGAMPDH